MAQTKRFSVSLIKDLIRNGEIINITNSEYDINTIFNTPITKIINTMIIPGHDLPNVYMMDMENGDIKIFDPHGTFNAIERIVEMDANKIDGPILRKIHMYSINMVSAGQSEFDFNAFQELYK